MKKITVCREVNTQWHKLSFEGGSAKQEPLAHLPSICFPPHWLNILTWKGNQLEQKHNPSAFTATHTCARIHAAVRKTWLSLAKNKSVYSEWRIKKKPKTTRTLFDYREERIKSLALARQIHGKRPSCLFMAAKPQSGCFFFFTRSNILFCIFVGGGAQLGLSQVRWLPWLRYCILTKRWNAYSQTDNPSLTGHTTI